MRLNSFITLIVLLLLFISGMPLAGSEAHSDTLPAGVQEVRVRVDGLACPFCVYNIEKRVKTLEGLDRKGALDVSVEKGVAVFSWKPNVVFEPAMIRKQIRKAGFTPGSIEITVSGEVTLQKAKDKDAERQLRLVVTQTKQVILLVSSKRTDRLQSYKALKAKTNKAKTNRAKTNTGRKSQAFQARIQGTVQGDDLWHLVLDRWEPLKYGAMVLIKVEKLTADELSTKLMQTLGVLKGVIHVEADRKENQVSIWTQSASPETDLFRKQILNAGLKVTQLDMLVRPPKGKVR